MRPHTNPWLHMLQRFTLRSISIIQSLPVNDLSYLQCSKRNIYNDWIIRVSVNNELKYQAACPSNIASSVLMGMLYYLLIDIQFPDGKSELFIDIDKSGLFINIKKRDLSIPINDLSTCSNFVIGDVNKRYQFYRLTIIFFMMFRQNINYIIHFVDIQLGMKKKIICRKIASTFGVLFWNDHRPSKNGLNL